MASTACLDVIQNWPWPGTVVSCPASLAPTFCPTFLLGEDLCRLLLQLIYNAGVHRSGGVAQTGGIVLGDFAQDPAHDLSTPRLGKGTGKDDLVRHGERPHVLAHLSLELALQRVGCLHVILENDIAEQAGALDLVREAHDCSLRGPGVANKGVLHL